MRYLKWLYWYIYLLLHPDFQKHVEDILAICGTLKETEKLGEEVDRVLSEVKKGR